MNRVILSRDDLRDLMAGEVVKKDNVEIILSDIGWGNIRYAYTQAVEKAHKKMKG